MKRFRHPWSRDLLVAAGYFLAAGATRAPAFFRSVLDWDESLYLLMAAQWRSGHLPYTTIWDNKPIGIYVIFALFEVPFGDHVAAIRMASVVFITLAAFAVHRITLAVTAAPAAALLAGAGYILCSLGNDGLAANTEPFMATFTALAVLAMLSGAPGGRAAALAGLAMGAAFMVKYVAVFEDPAILFLLLARAPRRASPRLALSMLAGAALPVVAALLLYWHGGQLPLWWEDSVAANFRRAGKTLSPASLSYICHLELWRWGPLFLGGALLLASATRAAWRGCRGSWDVDAANQVFLALWLLGGCVGVVAAKSFFDHYFLQLLPVLCVILGWWLHVAARAFGASGRVAVLLAALSLPCVAAFTALQDAVRPILGPGLFLRPDIPARIAADLAPALAAAPGGFIYVFDDQPIIYALLNQPPPTKFLLPSVLTTGFLAHVAGVDAPAEVDRILAKKPLFIIRRDHPADAAAANQTVYADVADALAAHYTLWRHYPGSNVYRRNS